MLMNTETDRPADSKSQNFRFDFDSEDFSGSVNESLQGGIEVIGKVFGGLVGAIKDAVGPELLQAMELAGWLQQLSGCLDSIVGALKSQGSVPAESAGQLAFYAEQFDRVVAGSKLESQQDTLRQHLHQARQAAESASKDPTAAVDVIAQASGYFKAAASSCVPLPQGSDSPE